MAFLTLPIFISFLFFVIAFAVTWAIVKFILYIFQSFGLLNIAKKEKYKYPYIVWIPGVSHYILGKFVIGNKNGIYYSILTIVKILLTIAVIFISNNVLFYSYLVYIVIYFIIDMLIMNKFYKKVFKKSEIYTIFTIITLGLLKPIFIYIVRIHKLTKDYMIEDN